MQLSYPITEYRKAIDRAFSEFLLQTRYASALPNMSRFTKFLTRVKECDPLLQLPESCATGLPLNWCYIQYNRGPLQIVEEDEFREDKIRMYVNEGTQIETSHWGYGRTELNFWLVANNGATIEACEALFYMRLYKIRNIEYSYQDLNWKSRIVHSALQTFESLEMEEHGTGFTVTWSVELFVPVLYRDTTSFSTLSSGITTCYVYGTPISEFDDDTSSRSPREGSGLAPEDASDIVCSTLGVGGDPGSSGAQDHTEENPPKCN
jgi:hypothetical protein